MHFPRIVYLFPVFLLHFSKNVQPVEVNSMQVDVEFTERCNNPVKCFSSMVKCTKDNKGILMHAKVTPLKQETVSSEMSSLFANSSHTLTFRLRYDTEESRYAVKKTDTYHNNTMTETITETLFYKEDQKLFKQFKTINEYHGIIEGIAGRTFVRLIVQFIDCGRLLLYGFIRHEATLYQIRPHLNLRHVNPSSRTTVNAHQISIVTTGIVNSNIFTQASLSNLKRRRKRDASKYRHCLIGTIADQHFFQRMNSNLHQVVIYIKTAFMLSDEIFSNSNWDDHSYKNSKIALPEIDIDLTIVSELGYLEEQQVLGSLINNSKRLEFCLLHLFTGKMIRKGADGILLGISATGGAFSNEVNVGVTSINDCKDPWSMRCLITFPRELAHSMGSSHESASESRLNESFIMTASNPDFAQIGPNDLKLSPESILNITKTMFQDGRKEILYVPATLWSICGNGIIEPGEECDEGQSSLCCHKCRLLAGKQCSPFNSLCCNEQCQFKTAREVACVPWNYCSNEKNFSANKLHFCQSEKISATINCDSTMNLLDTIIEPDGSFPENTSIVDKLLIAIILVAVIVIFAFIIIWLVIIFVDAEKKRKLEAIHYKSNISTSTTSGQGVTDSEQLELLSYNDAYSMKQIEIENKNLQIKMKEKQEEIDFLTTQVSGLKMSLNNTSKLNDSLQEDMKQLKAEILELRNILRISQSTLSIHSRVEEIDISIYAGKEDEDVPFIK